MSTQPFRRRARNPFRGRNPLNDSIFQAGDADLTRDQGAPPDQPPMADVIEPPPRRATTPAYIDPVDAAREAYANEPVTGAKGFLLNLLRTAGVGALQAAARNPDNPLGAAAGGAIAGGATAGINPQAGRGYQFDTLQRPGIEDRVRREDAARKRQFEIEDQALQRQSTQADIDLKRSTAEKNRRPVTPRAVAPRLINTQRGLYNEGTGQVIPGTEPPPREAAPRPITFEGRTYDYNDPQQRAALNQAQSKLPRDRYGRFISRSDERAQSRGSGSGAASSRREEQDLQRQMASAAAGINAIEKLAREAMGKPEAERPAIFQQMRAMRDSLQTQFPNLVEGGDHNNWPFARLRRREAPAGNRPTSTARSEAKRKLMAEGYTSAEADSELNRLGIQ